MSRSRLALVAVVGMLAALGAAAPAIGQDDDLPPLPPLPKPDAKATFDLIVEGKGLSSQTVRGGGSNDACTVDTNTATSQKFDYGRGKGVRVIFTKHEIPGSDPIVVLKRAGQSLGVKFTVVGSYRTRATGTATRTGSNPVLCVPADETIGDEQGCGRFGGKRTELFLNTLITDNKLSLEPADASPGVPGVGCGSNGVETVSGDPLYGWPYFPPLVPQSLPLSKVFGKSRAFKVQFEDKRLNEEGNYNVGGFEVRSVNTGNHEAIARFVRVRKKK